MDRYVGVDSHARSCTLGVVSASGRRLESKVVETNGRALVEAVRLIPGRVHMCLEAGTQSAWLYELLKPHVAEIVVSMPSKSKGAKDDKRDAWARAESFEWEQWRGESSRLRSIWRHCGRRYGRTASRWQT